LLERATSGWLAADVHCVAGMKRKARERQQRDVVTLADLAPRHRVAGGSQRRVFGANPLPRAPEDEPMAGKSGKSAKKDLPAKTEVKGGRVARNDNLTLVRVRQHGSPRLLDRRNAMASKKDLPAKKDVKGGKKKIAANDNLTLVRAANSPKQDLPAKKDVKGGKKAR
jgi:hypothetical protein